VLFVHGDSTPCLVFSKIAQGLVDMGYRVMLFGKDRSREMESTRLIATDLWGRGYSDTPLDCRHDDRLFAAQILLALTSSPLSWTGSGNSFSIVAFSLGGPISLAFTGAFPASVRSLVLLGPAGLLRKLPDGYDDQLMHQPELAVSQESIRQKVRQILGVDSSGPSLNMQVDPKRVVPLNNGPSRVEKSFDMGEIIQWQFDHHQGHVHSFQDTIRFGPLQKREDLWRKVCDILAGRAHSDTVLHGSKMLIFFGTDDDVVVGEETTEDILKMLPSEHLQVEYLPGGHGFPYPNSERIIQTILSFWGSTAPKF
jgi:pimeloyl-ACP methyl ester carboxylesterase